METLSSCWNWQPAQPSRLEQTAALLRLEGADALRFLHGQSSQSIETAAAGSCLSTCLISPTARMRGLAQVLVDATGAWLLIEAGDAEAVRTGLDRVLFPADRVQLGALIPAVLITPVPASSSGNGRLPAGSWQQSAEAPGIWQLGDRLLISDPDAASGHALSQLPLLSAQEHERWRIQQGWPSEPNELNDDTNPFELGLAARVSLNKGCYVGQETLAKLATYDGVKQQLRRWCCIQPSGGGADLAPGQPLQTTSGERAGVITSSLGLNQSDGSTLWLGLALVRRQALVHTSLVTGAAGAGTELTISKPDAFVDPPVGAGQRPA